VLSAAAEIEAIFAGDTEFGVPAVDLAALKSASPCRRSKGFWEPDRPEHHH
jgi:hypothetical protein